jgi:molybdopterin-binding protein
LVGRWLGRAQNWTETFVKLSARNILKGTITEVKKGQTTTHVLIDIGGSVVTSSITNEAADELKLAKGQSAYAVIKASDVIVGIDWSRVYRGLLALPPMRRSSVDVNSNDVSHRPAATSIAGNDETQRVVRKQCAVHVVGELNRVARKLWSDLGEGDDRTVAVRTGDPGRKASLLARLYGFDCAGSDKYIP